jgi:5-methyltetrahydrofolate--homocysteine methyltransferase
MEFRELTDAVIAGDAPGASLLTTTALQNGVEPLAILKEGLIVAMDAVGESFARGDIYVPEMMLAARAMQRCLDTLEPLLAGPERYSEGTVVLGTVKGDVHDIGKNIVAMMLKSFGFRVHDLGVDVSALRFLAAVEEHKPDIVGLSALLTTTMLEMKSVVDVIDQAGLRATVKVLVGGAPVTEEFAFAIGADGSAENAGAAVGRARELLAVR